jgi:tetratricopeptide (TPR) repeat protein
MGAPYFRNFYEPMDLSVSLRRWWKEPELQPAESASHRVYLLREWLQSRGSPAWVGAKHPLLTLCISDLLRAWGPSTRIIWCHRPLDEAIESLERLNWWANAAQVQRQLYEMAESSFPNQNGLLIDFHQSLARPVELMERLTAFLELQPSQEQLAEALQMIKPAPVLHGSSRSSTQRTSVSTATESIMDGQQDPADTVLEAEHNTVPDRIVATLLCGNCENIVVDAVKSVIDFVDCLLLIDTGCSDDSIDLVKQIAGEKLRLRAFPWQDDFSAARNFAMTEALRLQAQWALTIDSDERLDFGDITSIDELRARLRSNPNAQGWMVEVQSGSYQKERFIRLPTSSYWRGRTHEALIGFAPNARPKLAGLRFVELPKCDEEFQQKLERDLKILRLELSEDPNNGRAWFYLGQTLSGLKQTEGAIAAFDRCAAIGDWDELAAWACYRAAKGLVDSQRLAEAIERCGLGLSIDPRFPELAWMSAFCCLKLQRYPQAVAWAEMASAVGALAHPGGLSQRVGFRDLIGWYEGPYEILCVAYGKMGEMSQLERAKHLLLEARASRLRDFPDSTK